MRIFISVASPDRPKAEEAAFALRGDGHVVFLDDHDLPVADSYHERIRRAIERADLMIFFISPASISPSRYTLSEMKFAQAKWPHPRGCVLPVMVSPTPMTDIPAYLRAVSICMPRGDLAAEVAFEVGRMGGGGKSSFGSDLTVIKRLFRGGSGTPAGAVQRPPTDQALMPLVPMVALFAFIGLTSGLVTFMLTRGWYSDFSTGSLQSLTRGSLFVVVLCFMLTFIELAHPRTILTAGVGVLAAFLVADLLPIFEFFRGWARSVPMAVAGGLRAGIVAAALMLPFPEFRERRNWLLIVGVGAAAEIAYSGSSSDPFMWALRWALWDAAVAGALCFVLWNIADQRRGHGAPAPRKPRPPAAKQSERGRSRHS